MDDQRQPVRPVDVAEAVRMLREVLATFPPSTARERATARRVEGAAVGLDALAEMPVQSTLVPS